MNNYDEGVMTVNYWSQTAAAAVSMTTEKRLAY